jgi:hypothetical protein
MFLEKHGTNLGRRIVIHKKCKGLARNIGYPDIVEHLGIIKRNFAGDCEVRVTRMRGQSENEMTKKKTITLHYAKGNSKVLHWRVHDCNSRPGK